MSEGKIFSLCDIFGYYSVTEIQSKNISYLIFSYYKIILSIIQDGYTFLLLQNSKFGTTHDNHFLDLTPQASGLDKLTMPASSALAPAPIGQVPVSRRHSSSMFGNANSLTTSAALSESNRFFNLVGGALEILVEEQRFRNRAYSDGSSVFSNDSSSSVEVQTQPSATSRYKTELCRPFEESGKCKYGDKCQFAHGKHELRHMVRHPKYKTELCRTYHSSGLCPYGPRCHFIHNQDDPNLGNQQPQQMNPVGTAMPAPVVGSIPQTQRRTSNTRPINLQLGCQQQRNMYSYSPSRKSPLDTPSLFGANDATVIKSLSPSNNNGQYNFNRPVASGFAFDLRRASPPLVGLDGHLGQFSDFPVHDDTVFGIPTPPDSDRESATASPPGFKSVAPCPQRLPIFRCLSQSDKGV